jgi:hypothetical protein
MNRRPGVVDLLKEISKFLPGIKARIIQPIA